MSRKKVNSGRRSEQRGIQMALGESILLDVTWVKLSMAKAIVNILKSFISPQKPFPIMKESVDEKVVRPETTEFML